MQEMDDVLNHVMMMMCVADCFVRMKRDPTDDVFQFDLFLAFALPANIWELLTGIDKQREKQRVTRCSRSLPTFALHLRCALLDLLSFADLLSASILLPARLLHCLSNQSLPYRSVHIIALTVSGTAVLGDPWSSAIFARFIHSRSAFQIAHRSSGNFLLRLIRLSRLALLSRSVPATRASSLRSLHLPRSVRCEGSLAAFLLLAWLLQFQRALSGSISSMSSLQLLASQKRRFQLCFFAPSRATPSTRSA